MHHCRPSAVDYPQTDQYLPDIAADMPAIPSRFGARRISCDDQGARCKYRAELTDGTPTFIKAVFLPAPRDQLRRLVSECNVLTELERAGVSSVPRCLEVCDATRGCANASVLVQSAVEGASTLDIFAQGPHGQVGLIAVANGALRLLANLSRAGVAHRDLSGANLLVGDDDASNVHLVDFDGAVLVRDCAAGVKGIRECAPEHLMPGPPWDKTAEPITFNIPPEVFGACTDLWQAFATDALGNVPGDAATASLFAAGSFDLWGLGMALLHKLQCDEHAAERVWRYGLDEWRGGQREPHEGSGATRRLARLAGECVGAAPTHLQRLLSRLLDPQPARRGSAGELLSLTS